MNLHKYTCLDCHIDTRKNKKNIFMLKVALWKEFGVGNKSLFLGCFEKRLNRKIQYEDLTDCMMNKEVNPHTILLLKL